MRAEDVNPEWVEIVGRVFANAQDCDGEDGFRACARDLCPCRKYAQTALAAVAPIIAAAERERCAREVDCGCLNRDAVLTAETKADRWRACPRDPCGAVEAAAIRALGDADG